MTLRSILSKVSKRAVAVTVLAVAVVAVPASLLAWGPDRPTYTMAVPADHNTFNSITDATNYGDERNFVTIKPVSSGTWTDDLTVQNGQEYLVRMYVHNNAAANLGLVAHDVTAKFNIPNQTANRVQIDGYLSSSNSSPQEIWDQAVFHGDGSTNFNLNYVAGSAIYINNVFPSGTALPDSVVGGGAKLGYETMNGDIPGCFQYSGGVEFKVKATTTDFEVVKTVRKSGGSAFTKSVNVNPGESVDYQLYFKNTGGTNQNTVSLKDSLPAGMAYVADTTYVHDASGTRKVADGVTAGGMTMGNFLPNGDAYVKFTAKVSANDQLAACGVNKLVNTVKATTESGNKSDTADVTVTKECKPPVKIDVCRLSDKKIVAIDEKDFDTSKYTKDFSKCNKPAEFCTVPGKEYLPKDSPNCVVTPVTPQTPQTPSTPSELPHTGIADGIMSLFGLGSLVAATSYYRTSRRATQN